jgi:hypothetical protein
MIMSKRQSKGLIWGKCLAASSALVLGGCLIKQAQKSSNRAPDILPIDAVLVDEPIGSEDIFISSSKDAVFPADRFITSSKFGIISPPRENAQSTSIIVDLNKPGYFFVDQGVQINLAELSEKQLQQWFSKADDIKKVEDKFLMTSKSGIVRAPQAHSLSLLVTGEEWQSKKIWDMSDKEWDAFKKAIVEFRLTKKTTVSTPIKSTEQENPKVNSTAPTDTTKKRIFIHSSKAPDLSGEQP